MKEIKYEGHRKEKQSSQRRIYKEKTNKNQTKANYYVHQSLLIKGKGSWNKLK